MVTTAQAARLLNLTRGSVTSAIVRGRMRAEKRGERWYVFLAEVERYRIFHLHTQESVQMRAGARRHEPRGGGRRKKAETASEP